MPGDLVREQHIFGLSAAPDVVDHQRPAARAGRCGDEADVRHARRQAPGHDIARAVMRRIMRNRERLTMPREESGQIGNAPVIDVAIGTFLRPDPWIGMPVALDVLVHEDLQIDAEAAIRAHDHIGADATIDRHIAPRIGERAIGAIVTDGHADLPLRRVGQRKAIDRGLGRDERAKSPQPVASRLGPRFYDWQLAQTAEDLKKSPSSFGATAPGGDNYILPTITNALVGTQMKLVSGYKGVTDIFLAAEQGERPSPLRPRRAGVGKVEVGTGSILGGARSGQASSKIAWAISKRLASPSLM